MERNTVVWILILVMAAGLALFALQSSSTLNREMGGVREQEPPPAAPAPPPDPPAPTPPDDAEPAPKPPAEDRPPTLDDVVRELVLSAEHRELVARLSDGLKREIFDLMRVPRPDGGSLAEDLLKARAAGDEVETRTLMARAARETIPGTTMTYLDGKRAARDRAFSRLLEALGERESRRFVEMKADLEHLDTGFDPWKDALPKRP